MRGTVNHAPRAHRRRVENLQSSVMRAAPFLKWRSLCFGAGLPLIAGVAAHCLTTSAAAGRAIDAASGLLTFAWLFYWVNANGAALRRTRACARRSAARRVRAVRSRAVAGGTALQNEKAAVRGVLIPYDFC